MRIDSVDFIVLCGGKGTRLGNMTQLTPKPLLPIGGSPFLLRLLHQWRQEGFRRFVLAAHHLADQFQEFAARHSADFDRLEVVIEPQPMGTGGGLKHALSHVQSPVCLVANGDSYVSQKLEPMCSAHSARSSDFTLLAIPASHVIGGARQKGRLVVNAREEIGGFSTEDEAVDGWINGGIYVLNPRLASDWPDGFFDLEKKIFTHSANHIHVFKSSGNLMDIGIPDCYARFDQQLGPIQHLFSKLDLPTRP